MSRRSLRRFLFFEVMLVFFAAAAHAQGNAKNVSSALLVDDDTWTESVANLKQSMNEVLQKNEMLASENEILRKKVLNLQDELKSLQGDKEKFSQEPQKLNELLKGKSEEAVSLEK